MTTKTRREKVEYLEARGCDTPTIAKILGMRVEEVRDILAHPEPKPKLKKMSDRYKPLFIEPPSFDL